MGIAILQYLIVDLIYTVGNRDCSLFKEKVEKYFKLANVVNFSPESF